MDTTTLTGKLWQDVSAKVERIPGGKRYVEQLQRQYIETESFDEELIPLSDRQAYQIAVDMLAAKVEVLAYTDKLGRLNERWELKKKEFWLSVYEETGLNGEERLAFDATTCAIRKRDWKGQNPPDSYKATLDGFKELIEAALQNPVAAGRMAQDLCLPSWLRQMAGVLTNGNLKLYAE